MESDIRGVVEACRENGAVVKVILENAYLTDEEKVAACRVAEMAGADFVKTSTGFGPSGATQADVRLMRQTVSPAVGVKAAGGVRAQPPGRLRPALPPATDGQEANALLTRYLFVAESFS